MDEQPVVDDGDDSPEIINIEIKLEEPDEEPPSPVVQMPVISTTTEFVYDQFYSYELTDSEKESEYDEEEAEDEEEVYDEEYEDEGEEEYEGEEEEEVEGEDGEEVEGGEVEEGEDAQMDVGEEGVDDEEYDDEEYDEEYDEEEEKRVAEGAAEGETEGVAEGEAEGEAEEEGEAESEVAEASEIVVKEEPMDYEEMDDTIANIKTEVKDDYEENEKVEGDPEKLFEGQDPTVSSTATVQLIDIAKNDALDKEEVDEGDDVIFDEQEYEDEQEDEQEGQYENDEFEEEEGDFGEEEFGYDDEDYEENPEFKKPLQVFDEPMENYEKSKYSDIMVKKLKPLIVAKTENPHPPNLMELHTNPIYRQIFHRDFSDMKANDYPPPVHEFDPNNLRIPMHQQLAKESAVTRQNVVEYMSQKEREQRDKMLRRRKKAERLTRCNEKKKSEEIKRKQEKEKLEKYRGELVTKRHELFKKLKVSLSKEQAIKQILEEEKKKMEVVNFFTKVKQDELDPEEVQSTSLITHQTGIHGKSQDELLAELFKQCENVIKENAEMTAAIKAKKKDKAPVSTKKWPFIHKIEDNIELMLSRTQEAMNEGEDSRARENSLKSWREKRMKQKELRRQKKEIQTRVRLEVIRVEKLKREVKKQEDNVEMLKQQYEKEKKQLGLEKDPEPTPEEKRAIYALYEQQVKSQNPPVPVMFSPKPLSFEKKPTEAQKPTPHTQPQKRSAVQTVKKPEQPVQKSRVPTQPAPAAIRQPHPRVLAPQSHSHVRPVIHHQSQVQQPVRQRIQAPSQNTVRNTQQPQTFSRLVQPQSQPRPQIQQPFQNQSHLLSRARIQTQAQIVAKANAEARLQAAKPKIELSTKPRIEIQQKQRVDAHSHPYSNIEPQDHLRSRQDQSSLSLQNRPTPPARNIARLDQNRPSTSHQPSLSNKSKSAINPVHISHQEQLKNKSLDEQHLIPTHELSKAFLTDPQVICAFGPLFGTAPSPYNQRMMENYRVQSKMFQAEDVKQEVISPPATPPPTRGQQPPPPPPPPPPSSSMFFGKF